MRLIDADRLLEEKRKEKYYHLKNGDTAIPIIDIEHAPTIKYENDLISRKDAIEALGEAPLAWNEDDFEIGRRMQWCCDIEALTNLPSTRPHQSTSEWIAYKYCYVKCNNCGFEMPISYNGEVLYAIDDLKFCPNCGDEMR